MTDLPLMNLVAADLKADVFAPSLVPPFLLGYQLHCDPAKYPPAKYPNASCGPGLGSGPLQTMLQKLDDDRNASVKTPTKPRTCCGVLRKTPLNKTAPLR